MSCVGVIVSILVRRIARSVAPCRIPRRTRHDLDRLQTSSLPIGHREGDQMTQFERSSINDPESFLPSRPSLVDHRPSEGRERIRKCVLVPPSALWTGEVAEPARSEGETIMIHSGCVLRGTWSRPPISSPRDAGAARCFGVVSLQLQSSFHARSLRHCSSTGVTTLYQASNESKTDRNWSNFA